MGCKSLLMRFRPLHRFCKKDHVVKFHRTGKGIGILSWWCPSCSKIHSVSVVITKDNLFLKENGETSWKWNGDRINPHVSPCIVGACRYYSKSYIEQFGDGTTRIIVQNPVASIGWVPMIPVRDWKTKGEVVSNKTLTYDKAGSLKRILERDTGGFPLKE